MFCTEGTSPWLHELPSFRQLATYVSSSMHTDMLQRCSLLHVGVGGGLVRDGNTANALLSGLVGTVVDADAGDTRVRGDRGLAGGLELSVARGVVSTSTVGYYSCQLVLFEATDSTEVETYSGLASSAPSRTCQSHRGS